MQQGVNESKCFSFCAFFNFLRGRSVQNALTKFEKMYICNAVSRGDMQNLDIAPCEMNK